MKKILLTFSILISSPIFNTFAGDDNNIVEIMTSPIEEIQAIATPKNASKATDHHKLVPKLLEQMRNPQNSEFIQNVACLTLWSNPETKAAYRDELVSTFLNPMRDIGCLNSLINSVWNDQELKTAHYDKLVGTSLNICRNAKNERSKFIFLEKLWNDENARTANYQELLDMLSDLAQNGSTKEIRTQAMTMLIQNQERWIDAWNNITH
jgi:hypothetical protein